MEPACSVENGQESSNLHKMMSDGDKAKRNRSGARDCSMAEGVGGQGSPL